MSKGIRNYPVEERLNVVRRRLGMITKDFKPGLGILAAVDYGYAVEREAIKKQKASQQ